MAAFGKIYYSPNTFQSYGEEEIAAVEQFLRNHKVNDQNIVVDFENHVAGLFNVRFGTFVNSGSSANLLACLAVDITQGDEVITTACTFPTTLSPIVFLGATPVFCDIEERRYVPSVAQVLELVTDKTKAVLIPDLVGDKFDFLELKRRLEEMNRSDIFLIEDACDTVTQTDAHLATISFYASHIINAGGGGGMVLTDDPSLDEKCKSLRNDGPWDLRAPSFNAAFGLANAQRFETFKEARKTNFMHYVRRLKDCPFYELPVNQDACWLSMPLICPDRFRVVEELESRGIQTRLCMAGNILRQPFYAKLFPDIDPERFTVTEKVFKGGFLIGLHQGMTPEMIDYVCDVLLELAGSRGGEK